MRGSNPKLVPALHYYKPGRRLFGCLKNTQSSSITFLPEYYEQTHEPSLSQQKQFYKELAEQQVSPPRSPCKEEPFQEVVIPEDDDRMQKTEKERRRVEEHRGRYYEAIRAQVQEKESEKEAQHKMKKADGSFRLTQLKRQEEEVQQERLQKLSKSQEYCRSLSLQAQLKAAIETSESSKFSPAVESNASLPKNKNHLAADLASEFREPTYTCKHPKPVKSDPITFSHLATYEEARQRDAAPRHMSAYGLMMLQSRNDSTASLLVEPRYGKGQGLGYTDTRRLLV